MALSSPKTLATVRAEVRRELLDVTVSGTTTGRWWTDAELTGYLDDAQDAIQQRHELAWGSATATIGAGTATVTYTDVAADMFRPGVVFWNGTRLPFVTEAALDAAEPDWRGAATVSVPYLAYHARLGEIGLWPPLNGTSSGTLVAFYPRELTWTTDTATHAVPPYARPAMLSYAAWRAYLRNGANQDRNKAQRYETLWRAQLDGVGSTRRAYFPYRAPQLHPATRREIELLSPRIAALVTTMPSSLNLYNFVDEEPTGTVNGTNSAFVVSTAPSPASSLEFQVDGLTLHTSSYTVSSNTVTLGFAPPSGATVFARYRVLIT